MRIFPGRTGSIGSLLLGVPGPDGLQYAGRVGSGVSESTLEKLAEVLTPLRANETPFVGVPALDARDALWLRPEVVGQLRRCEAIAAGVGLLQHLAVDPFPLGAQGSEHLGQAILQVATLHRVFDQVEQELVLVDLEILVAAHAQGPLVAVPIRVSAPQVQLLGATNCSGAELSLD